MARLQASLCLLLAASVARSEGLPAWWKNLSHLTRLESAFVQESESAVFGKLKREGTLQLAKGGHLRVTYKGGMVLVADGKSLIQFDPTASTAQRLDLRSATKDMPLLNVLTDPAALENVYLIKPAPADGVRLEPKQPGLPPVSLEGKGGFLWRVTWTDATGAKQFLELKSPRTPQKPFPSATFIFKAPAGVRWIG